MVKIIYNDGQEHEIEVPNDLFDKLAYFSPEYNHRKLIQTCRDFESFKRSVNSFYTTIRRNKKGIKNYYLDYSNGEWKLVKTPTTRSLVDSVNFINER